MRRIAVLAALAVLTHSAPVGASPRFIPQPPPEPLGRLIADSKTIHVLRVASIDLKGVTFKTEATLKGEADKTPFRFVTLMGNGECEGLFRADEPVLCFRQDEVAVLHVGGRWALAVEPIAWRGEKNWFCMAEERYGVVYDGTTARLREHVVAILAGRETTVTARAPQGAVGGRLWQIKAGPAVTDFALSDESPHFVGWGTGEPDEATKLAQALQADAPRLRITAAADLANLGAAARPALPSLRRALRDSDSSVTLAAATTLARLDTDDVEAVEFIRDRLHHDDSDVRCAAAKALGDLGPRASSSLPTLLLALRDKEASVRSSAADAIGSISASAPTEEIVDALAALLKDEKDYVRSSAVQSLRSFSPLGWSAMRTLRESLLTPDDDRLVFGDDAVGWLARFDPTPVEILSQVVADRRFEYRTRLAAARQLGILRSQAQVALPALRRVLREPMEDWGFGPGLLQLEAADALLAVDPDESPTPVLPVLLELLKGHFSEKVRAVQLLGKCGAAARPALLDLVKSLDRDDYDTPWKVEAVTPLLGPSDIDQLPALQRLLSGKHADAFALAKVLYRLGRKEEAVTQAAKRLEGYWDYHRTAAARWLGERGREAKAAEPVLRKLLEQANGARRARLILTLAQVRGEEGTGARARAVAALRDLLALCEGEPPGVGRIDPDVFCPRLGFHVGRQESDAVGAAVGTVYSQLATDDDPVAVLAKALTDRGPHVRLAAAVALARAEPGHRDTVPTLQRLLDRNPYFFAYAADTLAALGPKAAPLAPQMVALSRHADDSVARAAVRVLRRIDPVFAAKAWGASGVPGAVPDDLGPLWDDLAGDDALRADLAVWRLAGAGSRTVALIRERLRPPPSPAPERIARLIADLDSDDFDSRERASAVLAAAVEVAAPDLRRTLAAGPPPEQRRRIEELLADHDPAPEERRRLRAVRVLEGAGVADGRDLLWKLARGDERFLLTEAAASALRRLDGR